MEKPIGKNMKTLFPYEEKFNAECWCYDKVLVKHLSEDQFEVEENVFTIVDSNVEDFFRDEKLQTIRVKDHSPHRDSYITVTRIINPGKYSDGLYHVSESGIERSGKSVQEAIAKIVAMCY